VKPSPSCLSCFIETRDIRRRGMSESDAVRVEAECDREADLEQLAWWVSMEHSFSVALYREAQSIIADHRRDVTPFTDAEFYMELRRIVILADNGHTNVSTGPIHDQFGLLPLRLYWFSDGLYIVRARNFHKTLLGSRPGHQCETT
jgi:hypothetical protein